MVTHTIATERLVTKATGPQPGQQVASGPQHMAHALVEVLSSGKIGARDTYAVPNPAVAALRKLEGPVAVVSIAGIYRSGKSFLLNCLAQTGDHMQLFEVGPTIQACTRGLWLWPAAIKVPQPDGSSLQVLFVDSEGLGSVGGTQQHDLQVFSLAMLISSLCIYNSIGALDESSISQLSFVTQLTKHIQIKSTESDSGSRTVDELDKFFPDFIWALRDFTLNLVDEYGNPITERECVLTNPRVPMHDFEFATPWRVQVSGERIVGRAWLQRGGVREKSRAGTGDCIFPTPRLLRVDATSRGGGGAACFADRGDARDTPRVP